MSDFITPFLMQSAVQAITPILLAALAGVLCGRVGVFNMALEGQMLVGAFAAIVGSYLTQSAVGRRRSRRCSPTMVFSLDPGLWRDAVFRGDAVVICIGMNLLASGLTAYLLRVMFGVSGTFSDPGDRRPRQDSASPALQAIPVLGWGFGAADARSPGRPGRWSRSSASCCSGRRSASGCAASAKQPDAAETLGVDVRAYRVGTVLVAGALAGLAGAQLSLGAVSVFAEDMTRRPRLDRGGRGDARARPIRSMPRRPACCSASPTPSACACKARACPTNSPTSRPMS